VLCIDVELVNGAVMCEEQANLLTQMCAGWACLRCEAIHQQDVTCFCACLAGFHTHITCSRYTRMHLPPLDAQFTLLAKEERGKTHSVHHHL
jgi:hypothetical protein